MKHSGASDRKFDVKGIVMNAPRALSLMLACLALLMTSIGFSSTEATAMEQDTDRQGQDYRSLFLGKSQPEVCQRACNEDEKCKAWTFVRPGFQGSLGRCLFKSGVPRKVQNKCCVSGVKGGTQAAGVESPGVASDVDIGSLSIPPVTFTVEQFAALGNQALAGNVQAMGALGLYHEGSDDASDGIPKDINEAIRWYEKAAAKGDVGAMVSLGLIYQSQRKNDTKAAEWFGKAADTGNVIAMSALSRLYADGKGVPKDAQISFEWSKKAAEADKADEFMAFDLAVKYVEGNGTRQDFVEATLWFRKAADKGLPIAMQKLGQLYAGGIGLAKNPERGFEWKLKAAKAGFPVAMHHVGYSYLVGLGVSANQVEAKRWFEKATSASDAEAMFSLAKLFHDGNGVTADPEKAAYWMILAIRSKSAQAAEKIMRRPWKWTPAFRKEFQIKLREAGVYTGKIDGNIGSGSRRAIAELTKRGQ